jgi:hypothetical protein
MFQSALFLYMNSSSAWNALLSRLCVEQSTSSGSQLKCHQLREAIPNSQPKVAIESFFVIVYFNSLLSTLFLFF